MPHGELTEIFPDVYMVTGTSRPEMFGSTYQFSRNMTVLRERDVLTLVNTVRLDDAGLAKLEALGKVTNLVRLGAFHGMDDAFYKDRYGAKLWSLPGVNDEHGASVDHELTSSLPLRGAELFVFTTSKLPEAVLRLDREGGILLSCDSLQNWTSADQYFDETSVTKMTAAGFFRTANVGPGWRMVCEPKGEDFARLRQISYRHLLPAHGLPILNDAPEKIGATLAELGL